MDLRLIWFRPYGSVYMQWFRVSYALFSVILVAGLDCNEAAFFLPVCSLRARVLVVARDSARLSGVQGTATLQAERSMLAPGGRCYRVVVNGALGDAELVA